MTEDIGCICKGNLRLIVQETQHLLGRYFLYRDQKYKFFGVVIGEDDYYYGMISKEGGMRLLSCVGYIEDFGYTLVEE